MNIDNFDELLYYLRQAASFIDTFPKMAVRECIPRDSLIQAANEIERLRKESYVWEMAARDLAKELGKEEYADAAYQDNYDLLEPSDEVCYE
jgi:uncharacterized protein YozE (UPF0346 family)